MKSFEERYVDKSTWGPGPWQDEPDKAQWLDEETGYPCLIVRSWGRAPTPGWGGKDPYVGGLGALCGYVGVPPTHPAYGKPYDDLDVTAHGGLTYADRCQANICHTVEPGESDNVWWLGFDCGHCDDLTPGMDAKLKEIMGRDSEFARLATWRTYKPWAYVVQECRDLARQLKALE